MILDLLGAALFAVIAAFLVLCGYVMWTTAREKRKR